MSSQTCHKEQKILTVVSLYILETALYILESGEAWLGDQYQYNTRHWHHFMLDAPLSQPLWKMPAYQGSIFYNWYLPEGLKMLPEKINETSDKLSSGQIILHHAEIPELEDSNHKIICILIISIVSLKNWHNTVVNVNKDVLIWTKL